MINGENGELDDAGANIRGRTPPLPPY